MIVIDILLAFFAGLLILGAFVFVFYIAVIIVSTIAYEIFDVGQDKPGRILLVSVIFSVVCYLIGYSLIN